jgi:hypothetical protein
MLGAVGATIDGGTRLNSMSDNRALAMCASWRHRLNGTFEAVECLCFSGLRDLERLVVVITANITDGHRILPFFDNAALEAVVPQLARLAKQRYFMNPGTLMPEQRIYLDLAAQ